MHRKFQTIYEIRKNLKGYTNLSYCTEDTVQCTSLKKKKEQQKEQIIKKNFFYERKIIYFKKKVFIGRESFL